MRLASICALFLMLLLGGCSHSTFQLWIYSDKDIVETKQIDAAFIKEEKKDE